MVHENGVDGRDTRLWHPFANMAEVRGHELVIERAEDVWVWDGDGRRLLDATASLWYSNVGHGSDRIRSAVDRQMRRLGAYSIFGDFANEPARELAGRLAELAPMDDARVFLTTGGGESIETAAKLARKYWSVSGQPQRSHLITRVHSYHGTHGFGTSLAGIEPNREGYGQLIGGTSLAAYDSAEALEDEIVRVGADRVAAFFAEPVIGAGGVLPPAPGYLEGVADVCERHGVLLIVDEVICGFGRLGRWYGIERFGVEPDMITFAKGVTSGYLPLGGVVVNGRVAEPFWTGDGAMFRHGPTYAGHPACCAAALANLDLLASGILERGERLEQPLLQALRPLADHSAVREVRGGVGLLGAVELTPEARACGGGVSELALLVREAGVLVRPLARALAISPPLTIEHAEITGIGTAIATALERFAARHLHAVR